MVFKPTLIFDDNIGNFNSYKLNTLINHKNSGGDITIDIYNEKLKTKSDLYSSVKFNSKQVINKNNTLSYKALITNSVSTTRSNNDVPTTFEDIFIKIDNIWFGNSDFLRAKFQLLKH